jgi:octaprenyl-diphosphate synthase
MQLKEIYAPIKKDMIAMERIIKLSIETGGNSSILKISDHLLSSGGKKLRSALVILSAKAVAGDISAAISRQVVKVASAVELVHMASLIHDDVVDHSEIRHNKPTINSKWGENVSIILGDYIYSVGFDLMSSCRNQDVIDCISQATRTMCEGELIQVCERDNLSLLKERYITIVKNKTANTFAASCRAGVLTVDSKAALKDRLMEYGLNFGIAFQIVDDSMDLIGKRENLGKLPGADFRMGEVTLPILNLLSQTKDKEKVIALLRKGGQRSFKELRKRFINSESFTKTKEEAYSYIQKAKNNISGLKDSCYKQSLFSLADFIIKDFNNS